MSDHLKYLSNLKHTLDELLKLTMTVGSVEVSISYLNSPAQPKPKLNFNVLIDPQNECKLHLQRFFFSL